VEDEAEVDVEEAEEERVEGSLEEL